MKESKKELNLYFENISLFIIGFYLLSLPLLFLSNTTDAFVLPKQIAMAIATGLFVIFFGLKMISNGKVKMRPSPFDLPVGLFLLVSFLSAIFSTNRFDALTAFVPLLFTTFFYFAIINVVRGEKKLLFVITSLTLGAVLSALLSIFSFFNIYLLPFSYSHVPFFTTFGSLLDQAIYFALILPITGYFTYSFFSSFNRSKRNKSTFYATENSEGGSNKTSRTTYFFTASFLVLVVGLGLTVFQLFTTQKPLILPFEIGLQTGFAAISQDTNQVFKSFLLGSGTGTYLIDFTRFKPASYNLNSNLWSFTFFRSSSFALELLATNGLLGLAVFIFLIYRVLKEGTSFLPILLAIIAAIVLPFSFTLIALMFLLLALFAVIRIHNNPNKYADIEFYLVSLKKGLVVALPEGERAAQNPVEKRYSKILPFVFFVFLLVLVGIPLYLTTTFFISDLVFQQSLIAASQNNGLQTYNLQISSIKIFPYRDIYYRGFAQTNLALANALATSQKGKTPNAQVQQNIVVLIQQAINSARSGTTVAPLTNFNWNNLSSVYRSLIGFGQNADKFTILTLQQAIALDPNNPQQYVELGGVYYQLGQFDDAIRQFQIAINLKNDYANAYYNLGHALESKGILQDAMTSYETVKSLVANQPPNLAKINADIATLQSKIGQQASSNATPKTQAQGQNQPPLDVNKPATTLPERKPPVKIPGPTISPIPSPTSNVSPTPAQ